MIDAVDFSERKLSSWVFSQEFYHVGWCHISTIPHMDRVLFGMFDSFLACATHIGTYIVFCQDYPKVFISYGFAQISRVF